MSYFRIFINGKNFLLKFEDGFKKQGFYTTRYVKAKKQEEAEKKALDLIRAELRDMVFNEKADPPMMYIEEIVEIESFKGISVPGKGFTFFPDNKVVR